MLRKDGRGRVDHFVVLEMENRPFEHFFGCLAGEGRLPGADGAIPPEGKLLQKNPHDAAAGSVNITCGTAPYSCTRGPGYSAWSPKFPCWTTTDGVNCSANAKPEAHNGSVNPNSYPYSEQSSAYSFQQGASGDAIKMFSPAQLPVKTALATEFGVFNRLFSAVPGFSAPNHMMMQSATSCGTATNVEWNKCGGDNKFFPQATIYDSLYLSNKSFGLYINTSRSTQQWNWTGGNDWASGDWPFGDVQFPDAMMQGVARHKDHFQTFDTFFEQAANGSLPHFSFLRGNNSNSDHPCYGAVQPLFCAASSRHLFVGSKPSSRPQHSDLSQNDIELNWCHLLRLLRRCLGRTVAQRYLRSLARWA